MQIYAHQADKSRKSAINNTLMVGGNENHRNHKDQRQKTKQAADAERRRLV